jgi:M6 family metalloprotease-like protein
MVELMREGWLWRVNKEGGTVMSTNTQDGKEKRGWRKSSILIIALLLVAMLGPSPSATLAVSPRLVPLYSWYDGERKDNFATTDPNWSGQPGDRKGNYSFVRIEGLVFNPDLPQPSGTIPLYSWYSPSRQDNFTTTQYSPEVGQLPPDYGIARKEGYIHDAPRRGTLPLVSWYNGASGYEDNFATTDPRWSGSVGREQAGYTLFRTEGYLTPMPDDQAQQPDLPEAFGYGSMKVEGAAARGQRPLLVVLAEYNGNTFRPPHTRAYYDQLIFGKTDPSIVRYFNQNSGSAFNWTSAGAGVFGPVAIRPGLDSAQLRTEAIRLAGAAGWQADPLDTNRDGQVTSSELGVVFISAAPSPADGGQTGFGNPSCVTPIGSSVQVCAEVSGVGEGVGFATLAHELSHLLGTVDLYGADFRMNANLTLMDATQIGVEDYMGIYHLDPWHKIQLGWIKPRIRPLTYPGSCVQLDAPQTFTGNREPLILYDPQRGRNEYFIIEHRSAADGAYDSELNGHARGIAIWYVRTDASFNAVLLPARINPGSDGTLESVPAGDDSIVGGEIIAGANDRLDSTKADTDVYEWDAAVWVVGSPPDVFEPGFRGQSTLWDQSHGRFRLKWYDTTDIGIRLRTGAPVGHPSSMDVEWDSGTLIPVRIDDVRNKPLPGGLFTAQGSFGVEPGSLGARIIGASRSYDLQIVRWSCDSLTLRVPDNVPPGDYQLVIDAGTTGAAASNSIPVTVHSLGWHVYLPFISRGG